jgi:magnesium-transporting ATPase (P-type)
MFSFIIKKIKNQKGAMDTIIVSLLLVLVGIGLVATLTSWLSTQTEAIKNDANITMQQIIDE